MYGIEEGEEYKPWLWPVPESGCIGQRGLGRRDGEDKVSGKAVYAHDVYLPGMLIAKPFLSPYAHARILSMDTSAAEALPGVRAILRYDDPDIRWPVLNTGYISAWYGPTELIAGEAKYQYQAVGAIVAADTELICDEALRLIASGIEWEALPFSIDLKDSALQPGEPILFPDQSPDTNLRNEDVEQYGDVEEGFAESPNIIEATLVKDPDIWAGVEGGCCVADYKPDGSLDLWPHAQSFCERKSRDILANFPELQSHKLRANVHTLYDGGVFGGIYGVELEDIVWYMAILASKATGKPVKLLHDAAAHFLGCGEDMGTYHLKIGYKDNGEVLAAQYHTWVVSYHADQISKIHKGSKVHNLQITRTYPFHNYGPYICYKHGDNACTCHIEVFNQVAAALDMDPTDVALINDGCVGIPMAEMTAIKEEQGFDPSRDSLRECIEKGKAAIDWDNKWHLPGTRILPNGRYHGVGFTWMIQWSHIGLEISGTPTVNIKLDDDGAVTLFAQRNDVGMSSHVAYLATVASEVGVKYEDVHWSFQNPSGYELQHGGGSFCTSVNIPPLVIAARKLKRQILENAVIPHYCLWGMPPFASQFAGLSADDLDIKDSVVFEKANPDNNAPIAAVANRPAASSTNIGQGRIGVTDYVMARQCYFMEVEVDPDTGKVYIIKVVSVYDTGKTLAPDTVNGQQYGGIYMGVGRGNTEQVLFDPLTGVKLTDDLVNYPIALMNDIEEGVDCHFIETGLCYGAYGSGGCSEAPAAVTSSLTRYAVHNAIGKWVDLKTTPDKILKALGKA